jgi:hypothetical protein
MKFELVSNFLRQLPHLEVVHNHPVRQLLVPRYLERTELRMVLLAVKQEEVANSGLTIFTAQICLYASAIDFLFLMC